MSLIMLSNSYVRYLTLPSLPPAPEHLRNLLPEYEITHILGSGGYATVYKAIGPRGKKVALKVPKTEDIFATMDLEVIDHFKSESELWMRLDHPNIVTLHSGKTEPLPHMAMELMEGGNLKQLMKNHALSPGEAVSIMEQVLKGLSFAHRMASVHRDLKPENILFTSDGIAKITDWGIGKFMASAGKSHTMGIKGTLDYCAPEQYDKREYGKVDWQTDIFQMGVMFYEMLTGENPFAGEDFADCMGKVLRYSPDPPSVVNPDVPEIFDVLIMNAIAKRKVERWDSGAVMLNELKRVIDGGKVKVSRSPKIEWVSEIPKPKPKAKGNACPECGNVIALENKKLRCKACKNYFCETCESWIDKTDSYKGYELKMNYPLCEDCYDKSYQEQVGVIKRKIREREEQKRLREERESQERLRLEREREENRRRVELERRRIIEAFDNSQEYKEVRTTVLVKTYKKVPVQKGIFKKRTEYVAKVVLEEREVNNRVEMRTNSIGMKFIRIPNTNYYMGKYTITQKEWKSVMGNAPWKGKSYVGEGDNYPATYISWNDCQEFVKKLNQREGVRKYRLPTEEEWEYACRAGSTTKYCFGDDVGRLGNYAWYKNMDNDRYDDNPKKVGQKKPNQWGLYDMHGNVWEWCQDKWSESGSYRVYRGGSWSDYAGSCESSLRLRYLPDNRHDLLGVRLVRSSD